MSKVFRETFTVPFDMVDVKQEIVLSQFISYCLGVSGRQSESIGRSDMVVFDTYGLVWVVTDYQLDISRLPRYKEVITIETQAVAYDRFMCQRDFRIFDGKGEKLLTITCYFVLIDFASRKLAQVPDELIGPYDSEKVRKLPKIAKLLAMDHPTDTDYRIRYFDIDMNGHVNNGVYLDWFYDVLGYDFLLAHRPQTMQLKYIKEISPGGMVTSRFERTGLTSRHDIVVDGVIHAQASITWEARDDN
ncbi:acyl-ACP thioesterase domain-containing protein [Streptococcus caprae]|uniref:Acyl-ACP thioesterase domain-containing protein n=1 Tax=Streptococcus caprae TaxID=1640501 RepID=A0ABV8CVW9_9STRE